MVSRRGGRGGGNTRLTEAGMSLLKMYLKAESESSHLWTDSRDGIPCVVVSVDASDGEVVLRSEVDDELTVTIRGSDLPRSTSVGDRIMLLRR